MMDAVIFFFAMGGFVVLCLYSLGKGDQRRSAARSPGRLVVRSREPLAESEVQVILCVPADEPWLVCVLQMIEKQREECTAECTDVDTTPELRNYYAGAVEHLQQLEEFIHQQREDAVRTREGFDEHPE